MDFNGYLLRSMMPYGHYDTRKVHKLQSRVYLNSLCAFVSFFCGVKALIITLTPWEQTETVFYLIELYVVNHELQRVFFLCLAIIHFATSFNYLYWAYLNSHPAKLRCLHMFFMPDINELCRHYELERTSA